MKKIVIIPSKNEDWILDKTLAALSLFADYIIIGDAFSWDKTPEIAKKYPKVIFLQNPDPYMGSRNRRQIMLDEARKFGADNLIFCFDADEIPSANILDQSNSFWTKAGQLKPGASLQLEWITLWKSAKEYRDDNSVWSGQYKPFVFRDNGVTNYAPGDVHESKVPAGFDTTAEKETTVKVLHFHFVLWDRMLSKQAHARLNEYKKYHRSPFMINFRYGITKEERGLQVSPVPNNWTAAYEEQGINLEDFTSSKFYGFDIEMLRDFKTHGPEKFSWLDIWDINWEAKRQAALGQGIEGMPTYEIRDPRAIVVKLYHSLFSLLPQQVITEWYGKFKQRVKRPT